MLTSLEWWSGLGKWPQMAFISGWCIMTHNDTSSKICIFYTAITVTPHWCPHCVYICIYIYWYIDTRNIWYINPLWFLYPDFWFETFPPAEVADAFGGSKIQRQRRILQQSSVAQWTLAARGRFQIRKCVIIHIYIYIHICTQNGNSKNNIDNNDRQKSQ